MREYLAYQGSQFTIEWYHDEKQHSQALEYFEKQTLVQKRRLVNLLRLIGDHGKIFDETKFRNEGDKIYAFKPQPDRYLCFFFKGKKIIITNAFIKKSQKLPQVEKEMAIKALQSYEKRIKVSTYYEEES